MIRFRFEYLDNWQRSVEVAGTLFSLADELEKMNCSMIFKQTH